MDGELNKSTGNTENVKGRACEQESRQLTREQDNPNNSSRVQGFGLLTKEPNDGPHHGLTLGNFYPDCNKSSIPKWYCKYNDADG